MGWNHQLVILGNASLRSASSLKATVNNAGVWMSSLAFCANAAGGEKSTEKSGGLRWVVCWEMILINLLETNITMENPPIEDVFLVTMGIFQFRVSFRGVYLFGYLFGIFEQFLMRCEFQTSCEQPIRFHERKRDKDWFQLNLMVQWYTPNATPPGCKTFLRKYWPPSSFNGLHKALFPGGWRWGGTLRYPVLFFVNICLTSLAQSNLQSSSHTKMPGTWFRVKDKIWHAKQTTLSTDLTLIGWFYIFLVLNVYPPPTTRNMV